MDPEALCKAFEKHPEAKAVIVVHLYGTPAKLNEIMAICEEHHVPLIEDAAESLSSTYRGKQTGTFGRIGIISFNGNKIITTSGGGIDVYKRQTSGRWITDPVYCRRNCCMLRLYERTL